MRNLFLCGIVMMMTIMVHSQVLLSDIVITPEFIDLGNVAEERGQVFSKFKFRVKGKTPFNLRNVTAGCGCTNVNFTPGVYHPGDSGEIKLTFNPNGLLGPVTREVWLEGNFKTPGIPGKRVELHAVVFSKLANQDGTKDFLENRYIKPGDLSLSRDQLYFGVHKPNFRRVDTIFVKNNSLNTTYTISGLDRNPFFLGMENAPQNIKPGDSIPLMFEMDLVNKDTFGEMYGRFRIVTNDKSLKFKEIVYYVKIDPSPSSPTKKELKKAPKIEVDQNFIDFGPMKTGGLSQRYVKITNNGKSPLQIWRIDTDCGCVKLDKVKMTISPGETALLEVTFDAVLKSGTQNKQIKLYTNDPLNKEFLLTAHAKVPK